MPKLKWFTPKWWQFRRRYYRWKRKKISVPLTDEMMVEVTRWLEDKMVFNNGKNEN